MHNIEYAAEPRRLCMLQEATIVNDDDGLSSPHTPTKPKVTTKPDNHWIKPELDDDRVRLTQDGWNEVLTVKHCKSTQGQAKKLKESDKKKKKVVESVFAEYGKLEDEDGGEEVQQNAEVRSR